LVKDVLGNTHNKRDSTYKLDSNYSIYNFKALPSRLMSTKIKFLGIINKKTMCLIQDDIWSIDIESLTLFFIIAEIFTPVIY
jgi:hypothetical protein